MNNLNNLQQFVYAFKKTEKIPALFLGHGSPLNAIEDNEFTNGFKNIAKSFQKPNAILCISAHWYTKGTKVGAMQFPPTIHDFGGFPKELYQVQYAAKGSPALAEEAKNLLSPTPVELNEKWGLDHGAWSVLKHLYPNADVPVVQLSIDYSQPPIYHFQLAQQLKSLRNYGILIIGSGNIIHNLNLVDFNNFSKDNYGYDWAIEAKMAINNYLINGNYTELIQYQKQSKAWQLAIPTPEHYLPLLYTLAVQENNEELGIFNDKFVAGSLSMTSLIIK